MSKRVSCKGQRKKRYFLRCDTCHRSFCFKEFSVRWKPEKKRVCADCLEVLRTCTPWEARKASRLFPCKRPRAGGKTWYEIYLESPEWKAIRFRVLERDGFVCLRCKGPANCVHHRSYRPEVIAGYADHELVSLCHSCHAYIEFNDDGTKAPLRVANQRLNCNAPLGKVGL